MFYDRPKTILLCSGSRCRIFGWGWTEQQPSPGECKVSQQLQYLDVGLVDQEVCQDDYHDLGWTIDMSNICSGVLGRTGRLLRILLMINI